MSSLSGGFSKLTGIIKENGTSLFNIVVILITFGGQEIFKVVVFQCPCVWPQNVVYGSLFLAAPALGLLTIGLVLSRALTRLITGCCKTMVPSKGADKCYLVWGVISQACVAPSAWLFVGFLDGSYYSCAKHQFPCSKNATELLKHEALKSESQMISWCILVGGVVTALTGFVIQRSCSRFTWHQYLYEELYEEYEITEYECEAKKRAQALAKENVAVFMDLKERSKIDWDTISTVPSQEPIDPNEKKDPLITSLQRWVLDHPPEEKEKEEETPT